MKNILSIMMCAFVLIGTGCSSTHGPYKHLEKGLSKVTTYEREIVGLQTLPKRMNLAAAQRQYFVENLVDIAYPISDGADQFIPMSLYQNKASFAKVALNYQTVKSGEQQMYQGFEGEFVPYIEWWLIQDVKQRALDGELIPQVDLHYPNKIIGRTHEMKIEDTPESYYYYKDVLMDIINNTDKKYYKPFSEYKKYVPHLINQSGEYQVYRVLVNCMPFTFATIYKRDKNMVATFASTFPRAHACQESLSFFPEILSTKRLTYARNVEPSEVVEIDMGQNFEMSTDFWHHFFATNLFPDSYRISTGGIFRSMMVPEDTTKRVMLMKNINHITQFGAKYKSDMDTMRYDVQGYGFFGVNPAMFTMNANVQAPAMRKITNVHKSRTFRSGEGGKDPSSRVFGKRCGVSNHKVTIAFSSHRYTPFECAGASVLVRKEEDPSHFKRHRTPLLIDYSVFNSAKYLKTNYAKYQTDVITNIAIMPLGNVQTTDTAKTYVGKYPSEELNFVYEPISIATWVENYRSSFESIDYLAYVDVIDGVTVGIVEWYGYRVKYDLTKLKDLFQGGNKMPYVSPRQFNHRMQQAALKDKYNISE